VLEFQSTLTVLCNFLPWWHLGVPFSILLFQLRVKWMHPWLISCYIAVEECIAFISPILQMGGGKKNTRGSLLIVEHMWNPQTFCFSKLLVRIW
jgi:hypothetical protein